MELGLALNINALLGSDLDNDRRLDVGYRKKTSSILGQGKTVMTEEGKAYNAEAVTTGHVKIGVGIDRLV